jgi:hypothetical protein
MNGHERVAVLLTLFDSERRVMLPAAAVALEGTRGPSG